MSDLTLTIIMPALNEEKNLKFAISNALSSLNDYNIRGELLCIDDGSKDSTLLIMKEWQEKDNRIRIISHETPRGFGASFWAGVMEAKMDAVVVIPGDNENDPWEILRYFFLLNHVDIVIPFVYNSNVRSIFRRFLSFTYRTIINFTFKTNLNYTNGTILYRSSVIKTLTYQSNSFFFQTDILIRLTKNGYLFAEVPYRIENRENGISKAVSFPSLLKVIKGYFKLIKDQYNKIDSSPHSDNSLTYKRYNEKNSKFIN